MKFIINFVVSVARGRIWNKFGITIQTSMKRQKQWTRNGVGHSAHVWGHVSQLTHLSSSKTIAHIDKTSTKFCRTQLNALIIPIPLILFLVIFSFFFLFFFFFFSIEQESSFQREISDVQIKLKLRPKCTMISFLRRTASKRFNKAVWEIEEQTYNPTSLILRLP